MSIKKKPIESDSSASEEQAAYTEFQEATRTLASAEKLLATARERYQAAVNNMHRFALENQ